MPYVSRNAQGQINGVFANPQAGTAEEFLANTDSALVAFLNPPPTAAQLLAPKLAAGITITSAGTSAISGTYALDQTTLDQIGSVARDAAAGLGLPGGLSTFAYPDITGSPKTFSPQNIQDLYKAMRNLVFALNEQAALAAAGQAPEWPTQAVTIS